MPIKALLQSMLAGVNMHIMSTQNPHCVTAEQLGLADLSYTDRGDPSSWDYSKADFTTDGEWHTLDLSGIVSEGATVVHLSVYAYNAYANSWIFFCKKGIVNRTFNREAFSIRQGGNVEYYESKWVACDEDRKIEYWMTDRDWGRLDMVVRGWI